MRCPRVVVRFRRSRRNLILCLLGVVWTCYGIALATSPRPGGGFGRLALPFAGLISSNWSALLWLACGAGAIVAAFTDDRARLGFQALLMPPLAWAALAGWSWVTWLVTSGEFGAGRAWVTSVVWVAIVSLIAVCAGWTDAPFGDPDPAEPDPDGDGRENEH
jgi:hypothetical protein